MKHRLSQRVTLTGVHVVSCTCGYEYRTYVRASMARVRDDHARRTGIVL